MFNVKILINLNIFLYNNVKDIIILFYYNKNSFNHST